MPLLLMTAFLLALTLIAAWPWLRRKQSRDKALTLSLVGALLAAAFYLWLGAPLEISDIRGQQQAQLDLRERMRSLLEASETRNLTAAEWAELGDAYMQAESYMPAAEAFRHAVTESGGEPVLILAYAKALMLAADGEITPQAREAFTMAASLMPDNPEPLFMLAVERVQAGDRDGARQRFEALLPMIPPELPLHNIVRMRLRELAQP